jgi:membrane protease YdiL (CAAX protease family)
VTDLRQAWIFVVSVLLFSWSFQAFIIIKGGVSQLGSFWAATLWIVALMCIPGALSILLRLVLKAGFADVSFRLGRGRYYVYAIAIPLVLALLVGLISSALDIRTFSLVAPVELVDMGVIALFVLGLGLIGAVGEEVGWRGFLLPKLMNGGARHPYLATGLIWAVWHLPLIAFGGYYQTDRPLRMAFVYGVAIIAMSFLISELRVQSRSVWVAAAMHAAHNFFFQFAVPALILRAPGSRSEAWDLVASDAGLSVAGTYAVAYLAFIHLSRRRKNVEGGNSGASCCRRKRDEDG